MPQSLQVMEDFSINVHICSQRGPKVARCKASDWVLNDFLTGILWGSILPDERVQPDVFRKRCGSSYPKALKLPCRSLQFFCSQPCRVGDFPASELDNRC